MLSKLLRAGEGRTLRHLARLAAEVNAHSEEYRGFTDAQLREQTDRFRARLRDGAKVDDLLVEAFGVAREASHRVLGQRHFDVQVMGGAALHLGSVAEMRTGEGKTLTCVLPAYLNALTGKGVHVVTVNDYLAQRDAEMMGRVHAFLGLSVGVLLNSDDPYERGPAYLCDITYGTNNEFGFDYLRDNMASTPDHLVQRGHHYAIVDEVDSILIDEARTPLIVSGPSDAAATWYSEFARIVRAMRRDHHYEVDEKKRTVGVNEEGVNFVEDQLGIDNLYDPANTPLVGYLNNAIKARELYRLDREYVVIGDELLIVDSFTGRVLSGRRFGEGMHQALEAKEGVTIQNENQTLATITLQNYFRLYDKLAGMTGTAMTEAAELHQTYKLNVVPIPTNQQMIRQDLPDAIYLAEMPKFQAVVEDIRTRHTTGQPVLVGTTNVEQSETLSRMLRTEGIPHEVLNAKQHEREAHVIAQAGRRGSVTVATNMAGRGTDIILGGNAEFIAEDALRARGIEEHSLEWEEAWPEALEQAQAQVRDEHEEVLGLGGLYVIGTERHESRRIDNQLRGRAGRQGDPGVSRFYLSMEDELMRRFNSAAAQSLLGRLNLPPEIPIESKMVSRSIQSAQSQMEGQNFEIRKNVLKYDEVLNKQRTVIYNERRAILEGADLSSQTRGMLEDVITEYVLAATSEGYPDDWDLPALQEALETLYPCTVQVAEISPDRSVLSAEMILEAVLRDGEEAYDRREEEVGLSENGESRLRNLERNVLLYVLDQKWREHLYEMDYLQEGIGLRAMGQRDPLVEYQREAFDMFNQMLAGLKEEAVTLIFRAQSRQENPVADSEVGEGASTEGSQEPSAADTEPAPLADTEPAPPQEQPTS